MYLKLEHDKCITIMSCIKFELTLLCKSCCEKRGHLGEDGSQYESFIMHATVQLAFYNYYSSIDTNTERIYLQYIIPYIIL